MRATRWIGRAGEITEAPARMCCWCKVPHWMTPEDAIRNAAGAPTSHGMCTKAEKVFEDGLNATYYGNGERA